MNDPIRLLIVDAYPIVRQGLRSLIATQPDMTLVGEADAGIRAVQLALTEQPDVLLLDFDRAEPDRLAVIQAVKREHELPTQILLFTAPVDNHALDNHALFTAMHFGAAGCLFKDADVEQLLRGIRDVAAGKPVLDARIALQIVCALNHTADSLPVVEPLTERERDVLALLAQGLANHEIAQRLTITDRTVGNHISNIYSKLHLSNRTQAALYALRSGLADPLDH